MFGAFYDEYWWNKTKYSTTNSTWVCEEDEYAKHCQKPGIYQLCRP